MAAATAVTPINVAMTLKRETKGTYVYATEADDAAVTQVYVRKSALPNGAPQSITLTIA